MNTWILILLAATWGNREPALQHVVFDSQQTCMAAKDAVQKEMNKKELQVFAVCVKK